jgi:hypothetical protein
MPNNREYLLVPRYEGDSEYVIAEVNDANPPKKGVQYAEALYRSIIPPTTVKAALGNPSRLKGLVGIGEIVDDEHPVRKHAVSAGREEPAYLGFAKQHLPKGTILGEYTGLVQRERLMKEQENERLVTTGSPPEGYNYTYAGGCETSTTLSPAVAALVSLRSSLPETSVSTCACVRACVRACR